MSAYAVYAVATRLTKTSGFFKATSGFASVKPYIVSGIEFPTLQYAKPGEVPNIVYKHFTKPEYLETASKVKRTGRLNIVTTTEFSFGKRPLDPKLDNLGDFGGIQPVTDGINALPYESLKLIVEGLKAASKEWETATGSPTVVILSGVFHYTDDGKTYVTNNAVLVCREQAYHVAKESMALGK